MEETRALLHFGVLEEIRVQPPRMSKILGSWKQWKGGKEKAVETHTKSARKYMSSNLIVSYETPNVFFLGGLQPWYRSYVSHRT